VKRCGTETNQRLHISSDHTQRATHTNTHTHSSIISVGKDADNEDDIYQLNFGQSLEVNLMFKYQRVTSGSPALHSVHTAAYSQCTQRTHNKEPKATIVIRHDHAQHSSAISHIQRSFFVILPILNHIKRLLNHYNRKHYPQKQYDFNSVVIKHCYE